MITKTASSMLKEAFQGSLMMEPGLGAQHIIPAEQKAAEHDPHLKLPKNISRLEAVAEDPFGNALFMDRKTGKYKAYNHESLTPFSDFDEKKWKKGPLRNTIKFTLDDATEGSEAATDLSNVNKEQAAKDLRKFIYPLKDITEQDLEGYKNSKKLIKDLSKRAKLPKGKELLKQGSFGASMFSKGFREVDEIGREGVERFGKYKNRSGKTPAFELPKFFDDLGDPKIKSLKDADAPLGGSTKK